MYLKPSSMTEENEIKHAISGIPSITLPVIYLSELRIVHHLCLEGIGEAANVGSKVTLVAEELNVGTVDLDAALLALGNVFLAAQVGEAPVLGDNDFLATGELNSS
jgi:hypothetical protein